MVLLLCLEMPSVDPGVTICPAFCEDGGIDQAARYGDGVEESDKEKRAYFEIKRNGKTRCSAIFIAPFRYFDREIVKH